MLTRLTFLVLILRVMGMASSFCAVTVVLTNDRGQASSALVRLLDGSGRTVDSILTRDGTARFCDFGFGDHSIDVGGTTCSHVVIPHVRVVFGKPQVFRVYVNSCSVGDVVLVSCETYFRVESQSGEKLEGVSITADSTRQKWETDQFGRVQISVGLGEELRVVFSKSDYSQYVIMLACTTPSYVEKLVVLRSQLQKE